MQMVSLRVGDRCWFYGPYHTGDLSEGTIVHTFRLDGWSYDHYVVQVETHIDPVLHVRCPLTVSDAPDRPIGALRRRVA